VTPGDVLAGRIKQAVEAKCPGRFWAEVVIDVDYPHEAYAYVCWPADDDAIAFVKVVVLPGLEATWDRSILTILDLVAERMKGQEW